MKKYLYISTGDLNGVYTLRSIITGPHTHQDRFIRRLSRDWDKAFTMGYTVSEKTGCIFLTDQSDEWALNEYGAGKKETIQDYYEWKTYLRDGKMPFGLHKNEHLEELPWSYREWLREQNPGNKLWDMLRLYLRPWEEDDVKESAREMVKKRTLVNSEFVGMPKEKLKKKLTCIAKSAYDSFYGGGVVSTMLDEKGNVIKTFGKCPIKEGETAIAKFVVKRHNTWQGNKETLVTRVAVDNDNEHDNNHNNVA